MKFSLATVAYVFALLAASMALFGAAGILAGAFVLLFWALYFREPSTAFWRWLAAALLVGLAVLMLVPAMASARNAALRNQCLNNLKQIMLGIEGYRAAHGTYPPAYTTDESGAPLLSWRVLILPYVEHQMLFNRFRLDEPWDGPKNRKLLDEMPELYSCTGVSRCRELGCFPDADRADAVANFVAVVGETTAWPPGRARSVSEVTDNLDSTVIVLEYSGGTLPWTAPEDLTLEEALDLFEHQPPQGHLHVHENFFTVSYYSMVYLAGVGSTHAIPLPIRMDRDSALALLTVAGGEDLSRSELNWRDMKGDVVTIVRWRRVYAALLFALLAVAPAAKMVQKVQSHKIILPD